MFISLFTAGVAPLISQETPGEASSGEGARPIAFRNSQVAIKTIQLSADAPANDPADDIVTKNSGADPHEDLSLLSDKKQAVEDQLREAKARLNSYQNALDIQTASHNYEKADISRLAVKDWSARIKSYESQLAQINKEIEGSTQDPGVDPAYSEVLVPGDNIELFVVEDTSFNNRYQIRRGGYIILPAVGRVCLAGKLIPDAEKAVKRALESSQLKNATVMIERIQGRDIETGPVVFLAGGFRNPGRFRIPTGTKPTLVTCILTCGGVTGKADLTRVKVMRVAGNKGVVEEVNVASMLRGGGLGSDLTLEEGDVVMVPGGAENVVYMTGNVRSQGAFTLGYWDKLGAYTAILQRGGFSRFADEKRVFVLRALPDGAKIRLPVDVAALKKGKGTDVQLQPNDIVVVPEKFFSF